MSRGLGILQRQIAQAFEANPALKLTSADAAYLIYGDATTYNHFSRAARALRTLTPRIGLKRERRYGPGAWEWVYSKMAVSQDVPPPAKRRSGIIMFKKKKAAPPLPQHENAPSAYSITISRS